jgi:putative redox protein
MLFVAIEGDVIMPVAITRYQGDMLFETEVGGQRITTDVTPPMGGKGRAPTPPDLFVVSLGACVAAFVAHYCEQQGIDTRDLTVDTGFEKTDKPAFLTNFRIDVRLPHAECGDREAAVKRVADHCIIHETLHHLQAVEIHIHDSKDLAPA